MSTVITLRVKHYRRSKIVHRKPFSLENKLLALPRMCVCDSPMKPVNSKYILGISKRTVGIGVSTSRHLEGNKSLKVAPFRIKKNYDN